MSGNSANTTDEHSTGNTYVPDQSRKYNTNAASYMNSRFYPDLLRSSSAVGINMDMHSGSSSIDSDSTLIADTEVGSSIADNNYFNDATSFWQNMYNYNNHHNSYATSSSIQCSDPQFQQHNYNYHDFDSSYKNSGGGILYNVQQHQQQQQWANGNEVGLSLIHI